MESEYTIIHKLGFPAVGDSPLSRIKNICGGLIKDKTVEIQVQIFQL